MDTIIIGYWQSRNRFDQPQTSLVQEEEDRLRHSYSSPKLSIVRAQEHVEQRVVSHGTQAHALPSISTPAMTLTEQQGCCASSPAPPYNGGNASSRNPIISQQPQSNAGPGRPSTARSTGPQVPTGAQATNDPKAKPDRTLKPLVWTSKDRIWTRQGIDQEREDFFFTRVTGRQEVWQTIRTALEVIWAGGDPVDQDGGIKTAHEILKAASITLPHSTLDRGVFDVTGVFYSLPQYVVCE